MYMVFEEMITMKEKSERFELKNEELKLKV